MYPSTFDRLIGAIAIVITIVIFLGPILVAPALVSVLYEIEESEATGLHLTETTVGIGVILRATLRRIFQSSVRNVMQTTVGTFARATARTVTRRVIRLTTRTVTLLLRSQPETPLEEAEEEIAGSTRLALVVGVLVLVVSFGVLLRLPTADGKDRFDLLTHHASEAGAFPTVSLAAISLAAAAPLGIYAILAFFATRVAGIRLTFHTGFDSVLMQAYFIGGGSFLPLATDSHYHGSRERCALASVLSLLGMLVSAAALFGIDHFFHVPLLGFISHMCVLYAFIYSFPILPLDGAHLWRVSKMLWLVCWLIVLAAFIYHIPESFNVIL